MMGLNKKRNEDEDEDGQKLALVCTPGMRGERTQEYHRCSRRLEGMNRLVQGL